MLERLVHKVDFERLLGTRSLMRSAHFALHHVSDAPMPLHVHKNWVSTQDLSTALDEQVKPSVDNSSPALWIGCVVPKRHARRAVTRSLLKRQIRDSFVRHAERLSGGMWLVRLRAGFATTDFVSARSFALARTARVELDGLLDGLLRRAG